MEEGDENLDTLGVIATRLSMFTNDDYSSIGEESTTGFWSINDERSTTATPTGDKAELCFKVDNEQPQLVRSNSSSTAGSSITMVHSFGKSEQTPTKPPGVENSLLSPARARMRLLEAQARRRSSSNLPVPKQLFAPQLSSPSSLPSLDDRVTKASNFCHASSFQERRASLIKRRKQILERRRSLRRSEPSQNRISQGWSRFSTKNASLFCLVMLFIMAVFFYNGEEIVHIVCRLFTSNRAENQDFGMTQDFSPWTGETKGGNEVARVVALSNMTALSEDTQSGESQYLEMPQRRLSEEPKVENTFGIFDTIYKVEASQNGTALSEDTDEEEDEIGPVSKAYRLRLMSSCWV